jgi:superfamily I DNA and/or RNA helicase
MSTVDDFQGDERDIIFVSMVRNPKNRKSWPTAGKFLKEFERINVAFSRARRLLIIVGAKEFLSEATIDLPDMSGNRALDKKAYPVYKEIIDTIYTYGMVHRAADIIGEEK